MAIPVYLWLYNHSGALIKGDVDIEGREGSIEVLELMHTVEQTIDNANGKITAKRQHSGYAFEKEIDTTSPYLYRALTSGESFSKAVFKFYQINHAGEEQEYFRTTLDQVKVSDIESFFAIQEDNNISHNHHGYIDLAFGSITWNYLDGNITHTDQWNKRT